MLELRFSLQPKQKLFRETVDRTPVTLYGGAKGGGKSKGLRDILLIRRFQYPGTHAGLFRQTYPELEGNHIRPLFKDYPGLREFWNDSKKLLSLPNGSSLQFCHCQGEKDVSLYQGREFEDLAIDEVGQWPEPLFRTLQGSNRSSTPGFRPRVLLTANPGGLGHQWLKRVFIEKRLNSREDPSDYAFIQALVDDNPALIQNDPGYVRRLEAEPNEALRKAYRYGDWDVFAGQFFGELSREVHLIPAFEIPPHWRRFGSYDFGFNHPAAFGWFAGDEDGNVFLYREYLKAQRRVDQFAADIKKFPDTLRLDYIKAGHDCWAKKAVIRTGTPPTIAEEFQNQGITLSRAQTDRVQGANQVRNYLAWQKTASGRDEPRFFIFDTCPITYDTLGRMQTDPDCVEDVLKVDASEGDPMTGDDGYDMVRYGLMSRPQIADRLRVTLKPGTPQMVEFQRQQMEDRLERDIARQQADEAAQRQYDTLGMDSGEIAHYYLKKRSGG